MQKQKHQKTQSKVKKIDPKTLTIIADSLKSPQRQTKDPKFLRKENEAYSIFATEKVKIFLETIDDPKHLQWTIPEYWKNIVFTRKSAYARKSASFLS